MALRVTRRTDAAGSGALGLAWRARAVAVARQHWLVCVLLGIGLVLRVLAQVAYRPALVYVDSLKYLYGASPGSEPLGYTELLKVVLLAGGLGTVTAIQHLLGLAMAVTLYAVLARRGVPRWGAALAVAPVLADAYQVQMEQMVMPDVWFEALIVAGLAVLLWQPEVTLRRAAAAGVVLAVAATVKQLGESLVVPAAVYLLAAGGGWRQAARRAGALALAFVLVVLCYCGVSFLRNGHFRVANQQALTGRLVAAADCATLKLPAGVRPLCPTPAQQQALGPDSLEHNFRLSPLYSTQVATGTRGRLIAELKSAVVHQQPLRVVGSVLSDSLRLFALTRQPSSWVTPISRWQFQAGYPTYPPWTSICTAGNLDPTMCMTSQQVLAQRVTPVSDQLVRPGGVLVVGVQHALGGQFAAHALRPSYGGPVRVDRPVAAFLRSYQLGGGYTPGPLLALLALAALAGSVAALTRRARDTAADPRTRQLARACLLSTVTAAVVLLSPDLYEFSWRYQLPAVVTLVPAGVLGAAALAGLRRARQRPPAEPAT
ncbi:MAG TPA: hypothetical protein VGS19_27835 [Streptosporangiaceae bacterium]|nr:hypothetical protein [Streptosporangiaceae bacterium]